MLVKEVIRKDRGMQYVVENVLVCSSWGRTLLLNQNFLTDAKLLQQNLDRIEVHTRFMQEHPDAAKELVMVLGGMFMLSKNVVVYSNIWGKAAQVGFIASLILSFFHDKFEAGNIMLWGMTPDILLLWITVALAVIAMVVYGVQAVKTIRKNKEQ